MKFPLHAKTSELLAGLKGIEIGAAAHNPFGVDALNLAPKSTFEFYAAEQRRLGNEPTPIDIDAYADKTGLADNSQDFVLSSHVIEHLPDLVEALKEWERIIRPGGYIVIIAPLPSALPSDAGRPLSTFDDISKGVVGEIGTDSDTHHWVFTLESFKAIMDKLCSGRGKLHLELVAEEAVDKKVGNGWFVAYKVTDKPVMKKRTRKSNVKEDTADSDS